MTATPIQVTVGAPSTTSLGSGSQPGMLGGVQADGIVSELNGKYYTDNYYGNVYYASNAGAGAAFSIYSNTTFVGLAIWNPQGSGKNLSMLRVSLGLNTTASTAMGAFGYCWIPNAGSGLATAAPISAFTAITATRGSAICGLPSVGSSVALAGSGATLTTAMAWGRPASFSAATGAITTAVAIGSLYEDFDGMMIVPPGTFWTVTTSILTGITGIATAVWAEKPL